MLLVRYISIFLVLIFVSSLIGAYVTCDGGYSPYPTKCQGGSLYDTAVDSSNMQPIYSIVFLILIIIIIWLLVRRNKENIRRQKRRRRSRRKHR